MRKLSYLAAALLLVTTLTACGTKATDSTTKVEGTPVATEAPAVTDAPEVTEAPVATEAVVETITVEHSLGTVTVPVNPSKAVIMDLGILDTVQQLGVEAEISNPTEGLPEYLSAYTSNVNAGSLKEPDLEAIFEFEPEVIIISGRQSSFYDQLNEIAPTVFIELNSEVYMEDFAKNTRLVAQIFGKEAVAEEKLTAIDAQVKEVQAATANLESKALVLMVNDGSLSAYGKGSRFGMIHDLLGVKAADENIEASTHGMEANYEYVSEVNPDIIFVIDRSEAVGTEAVEGVPALDNELVNATKAATNNKIVKLDSNVWYKVGGGITSMQQMVNEIAEGIK